MSAQAAAASSSDPAAWKAAAERAEAAGRPDLAARALMRAAELAPTDPIAWFKLGNAWAAVRQIEAAEAAYREAARLLPERRDIHINIGAMQERQNRFIAAKQAYETAAKGSRNRGLALSNLGGVLSRMGDGEASLAAYRQALEGAAITSEIWSNYLYTLHYSDAISAAEIVAEHRRWGAAAAEAATPLRDPADRDRAKRRLRIGYMSPDLVRHSVAYFALPILLGHDRRRVEVVCYQAAPGADDMTAVLKEAADGWRDVSRLDDDALAATIAADEVDVLIDLAGHTAKGRPGVLARRPAPLQAGYLGYPNVTGLPTVDLRFVDAMTDPDAREDAAAPERRIALPRPFMAYAPPTEAPAVRLRPAGDGVVFASFNNLAKASPACVDLWAETLLAAPGSRLLLKAKAFAEAESRERFAEAFARRGVGADRLDLRGHTGMLADHLSLYGEADIALDSFPYNGATTTMEALWMGTPVVSLAGRRHAARVGASLLGAAGLADLVATDARGFVAAAARLAADADGRRSLAAGLRDRLASGPLLDGAAMARALEDAIFAAWTAPAAD